MFFTRRSASQKRSAALRRRKLFLEPLEDRRVLTVELVSIADSALDYNGGNSYSNNLRESISDDGRYVAFRSDANNLVPGDTNGAADIFVRDRVLGTTVLASTDASGNQSNGYSDWASISGNGRYVAFRSDASNLVLNDTNGTSDIFVKDLQTGAISRASIQDTTGLQSDSSSDLPSISDDGRYVAFQSYASNLVVGDTNGRYDIFVHDQTTGSTTLASVDSSGLQAISDSQWPAISGNGLFVSFYSDANNLVPLDTNGYGDIFVRDLVNGTTERVNVDSAGTQANYYTDSPSSISDDGRYVVYSSYADNLVAGDTNGTYDIFVRDRQLGTTIRASVDSVGGEANNGSYWPSISGNGQFVAFYGNASNLVPTDTNSRTDIFLRDLTALTTELVSLNTAGQQANDDSYYSALSDDGRYVAFTSRAGNLDTGSYGYYADNVFVRDRLAPATELISVRDPASPPIFSGNNSSYHSSTSADGRYIAFTSYASNLVVGDTNGNGDIFVRDRVLGTTTLVSTDALGNQGNSYSEWPSISADGQFVAFMSYANNLVAGDTNGTWDVFVKNLSTGAITRVSVDSAGSQANSHSYYPSLNADGSKVAFWSYASNLAAGDTNSQEDIFWHDLSTGITQLVSANSSGSVGDQYSYWPSISGDGRYIAFMSYATNLVPGDTNGTSDTFVKDVVTGAVVRVSTDSLGNQSNGYSEIPAISQNGRYVSFNSSASNLVAGDTNGNNDVFVKDLVTGATTLESVNSGGTLGNNQSYYNSLSADGRYLAFSSYSTNLDPVATNGYQNIYYRDRIAGTTQLASITSGGFQANDYSYEPSISANGLVVSFWTHASLVPEDGLFQYDVYAFSPGSPVLGSLDATLTAGALTVTDISPAGKNNDLLIRVVGANLVISDVNEQFTPASAAATGGTLSPDLKTLTIPLVNITSTATILTQGGTDLITVDYAGAAIGKALVIRGGTPGVLPGDKLVINNPSTAYPFVVDTNGGKVDASNDPTLNFSEIEQVSFLDTTSRDLPFGQFYARGTSGPDYMLFMSSGQVDPSFRLRIGNTYFPKSGGNYGPYLSASASPVAHVYGRGSNDTLSMYNTRINGALYGEDGDDILTGGYGNDLIVGGAGNDRINGGTVGGDDEIWGDNFDPAVDGISLAAISAASQTGTGNDQINTFGGNDTVYGQGGADIINTGGGNDYINGGPGNDQIDGQGGDDRIYGGDGNDVINGSDGNDLVVGNDGNDTLYGGNGNDILIGGLGQDTANGGAGGDVLIGDDSNNAGNSNSRAKGDTADAALLGLLNLWNTLPTPTAATLASLGGFGSAGSDGSVDTLYGNAGADAFFSLALDLKPDRVFPGDLN